MFEFSWVCVYLCVSPWICWNHSFSVYVRGNVPSIGCEYNFMYIHVVSVKKEDSLWYADRKIINSDECAGSQGRFTKLRLILFTLHQCPADIRFNSYILWGRLWKLTKISLQLEKLTEIRKSSYLHIIIILRTYFL